MKFSETDQIEFGEKKVIHKSAGGFVFYESPESHALYVALLQKSDNKFYIPKGHLLKDESSEVAAVREIKEELMLKETPKLVAELGMDSYTFNLPNDNRLHYKYVNLYVFILEQKNIINPLESEGFINAKWLKFDEAFKKMAFDKDNLLKARQLFYFNKYVHSFNNFKNVNSISAGIPSYNGSKTIYQALQSVVASMNILPEHIFKEIIVCCDHCTDDTETIVKYFISKEDYKNIRIKLIYNKGIKGKSTTLNEIFLNSNSDFICFIDDDVILDDKCILNLVNAFIIDKSLLCDYASWKRKSLDSNNIWRKFCHLIFGIKFDIQQYDKPSEIMRASCMMLRKESFVHIPDNLINDDQFLQYVYWPRTQEIHNAVLYFNSVSSVFDYYKRFIRIASGIKQINKEFINERINECSKELYRKIDYKKIFKLPLSQLIPFLIYRFIRLFVNIIVKIKLKINDNHEWLRIKQN